MGITGTWRLLIMSDTPGGSFDSPEELLVFPLDTRRVAVLLLVVFDFRGFGVVVELLVSEFLVFGLTDTRFSEDGFDFVGDSSSSCLASLLFDFLLTSFLEFLESGVHGSSRLVSFVLDFLGLMG